MSETQSDDYEISDLILVPDGVDWVLGTVIVFSPITARWNDVRRQVPDGAGKFIRWRDVLPGIERFIGTRFESVDDARAVLRPFVVPRVPRPA